MSSINRPGRKWHKRLRELRGICGFTQASLAGRIGVSTSTVVGIERGTLDLSRGLATRIMVATGVTPDSLLNGPKLVSLSTGGRYGAGDWEANSAAGGGRGRPVAVDAASSKGIKVLERTLGDVARAAAGNNHYDIFEHLFREWMDGVRKSLDLPAATLLPGDPAAVSGTKPAPVRKRKASAAPGV